MQIRALTTIEDYAAAVELQRVIWGMNALEMQPADTFAVAEKTGGRSFGAFHGSRMVGFCLGLPAFGRDGSPYIHSHMLGVIEEFRNRSTGLRLKMAQREDALARSISRIEWTFDPLQSKNACFNMKLGAIVRRCYRNFYGSTSNSLDAGLPTDRCMAEWWLTGEPARGPVTERILIPQVRTSEAQQRLMDHLEAAFARGLAIVAVERNETEVAYLLGECSPQAG